LGAVCEDDAGHEEAARERRRLAADESIVGKGAEYDPPAFSDWPLEPCCLAARGRRSAGKCLIRFQLRHQHAACSA
jgi:hypothetical protein